MREVAADRLSVAIVLAAVSGAAWLGAMLSRTLLGLAKLADTRERL